MSVDEAQLTVFLRVPKGLSEQQRQAYQEHGQLLYPGSQAMVLPDDCGPIWKDDERD